MNDYACLLEGRSAGKAISREGDISPGTCFRAEYVCDFQQYKEQLMTTATKPRTYLKPGDPDSVVTVKPRYENFIGGRWVPPVSGEYTTNLSPATGQPFTQVPRSGAQDIELALDAAHAAKDAWGETSTA